MSAPWEVFVSFMHDSTTIDDCFVREDGVYDGDTRYLRASLTCGECANFTQNERRCVEMSTLQEVSARWPACMAFQPRTERIERGEE